jgi:hypothetical protein
VPIDSRVRDYACLVARKSVHLDYAPYNRQTDSSIPPQSHIITELCTRIGIKGMISLRPYFYLTDDEVMGWRSVREMIAIQSSVLGAKVPMRNKEWFPERFQEVVNQLHRSREFVQIGSENDPPLKNVRDLRGRTSIRDVAAALANCRLYVGGEGFLMHLARAVGCPSVIVYGGRQAPWQTGYSCNVNLFSAVQCAPCWAWNTCLQSRVCMERITVTDVVNGIHGQLAQERDRLVLATVEI